MKSVLDAVPVNFEACSDLSIGPGLPREKLESVEAGSQILAAGNPEIAVVQVLVDALVAGIVEAVLLLLPDLKIVKLEQAVRFAVMDGNVDAAD